MRHLDFLLPTPSWRAYVVGIMATPMQQYFIFPDFPLLQSNNLRREGSLRRLNGPRKEPAVQKPELATVREINNVPKKESPTASTTGGAAVPRYMQSTAATKARLGKVA